jgi:hypothetical protein
MPEENMEFEFNYASFSLKPYSGHNGTSTYLLKSIINKLNEEDFPGEKKIIDRHKGRKNTTKRKIVIISNRFEKGGLRCFGKIALIKNKAPLLWSGKDIIEEIEKEENKQFIEITNYAIHFNENADPVIMHEFNHEGPRLSDIEFYLRQIASEFRLAKNIRSILHLRTDYEQLDKEMKNVFAVTVKVNSIYTNRYEWLKTLKNLSDDSGFKDVRLEFFYKRRKEKNGKYEKNIIGTDFARGLLGWIGKDKKNIAYLDDLKMSYQIGDDDEIIDLDFLKNKVVSIIKIPFIDGKKISAIDFKSLVAQEFNYYLTNGKTNSQ